VCVYVISENFRWISAEKLASHNLAENYKSQQNTTNPKISFVFFCSATLFFLNAAKKSN